MMSTPPDKPALRRVTLGFVGGLTLTRQMTDEQLSGLRAAVERDTGWHEVRTEQQPVVVSLRRLAFFELDETGRRVGFC